MIWRGCYNFKNGLISNQANFDAGVLPTQVSEEQNVSPVSNNDSFERIWFDDFGALYIMGATPYLKKGGLLRFTISGRIEAINTFLRLLIFNVVLVALNNNVILCGILLVDIELIRLILVGFKGCQERNLHFLERTRLFFACLESLIYLIFYWLAFYSYFLVEDSVETPTIPYNVQLGLVLTTYFTFFTLLI